MTRDLPPVLAERLLRLVLRPMGEVGRSIIGDLREEFASFCSGHGRGVADRWYVRQAGGIAIRVVFDRVRGRGPFRGEMTRPAHVRRKELWTMRGWLGELRQAARSLGRVPQYTAAAVLTLALAVAANTVVFSVTNSILLEPLPYRDANALIVLGHAAPGLGYPKIGASPGLYHQYRENVTAFGVSGMYTTMPMNITSDESPPERIEALASTWTLFDALGVPALLGRGFSADEDAPDASGVVVLGHEIWQRRFGGDGSILGRTVRVNGEDREVIGVMPPGFAFPDGKTSLWLPLRIDLATAPASSFSFTAVARLNPGATIAEVRTQMTAVTGRLPELFPTETSLHAFVDAGKFTPVPIGLKESIVGDLRRPLFILLGTAALVLLIACANVTNLFLVRAETRQRDIAVRSALGAGRGILARHFLAESALIALFAGIAGMVLGASGVYALVRVAPAGIARIGDVSVRPVVLAYAAMMTAIITVLLAVIPALRLTRPGILALVSRSGTRTTAGRERHRTRQGLVVIQTALALVLLVGSGLMLRTFAQLRSVDPGFDSGDLLTFRVSLPPSGYPDATAAAAFHEQLLERLRAIPGVRAAAAVGAAPLANRATGTAFTIADRRVGPGELDPMFWYTSVSKDYFDAMHIPVRAGESFDDPARESNRLAVIVSEAVADRLWPGENAIGKQLRSGGSDSVRWNVVIGVVGDVRQQGIYEDPSEMLYFPLLSAPSIDVPAGQPDPRIPARAMTYVLRGPRPEALAAPARAAVWQIDSSLPIAAVQTMDALVGESLARTSFTMLALVIAALLALFLGAIGLYGVISYSVTQRTREIGLRIALGARPSTVRRMVVWQGFQLATMGLVLGIAVSLAITRLLAGLLYDTSPTDPLTFSAVVALLATTGFAASWLPALRASRVDPARSLQAE